MSIAGDIARIWAEYPNRGPRESLEAVERLRQALPPAQVPTVGVVGTNGKTSTATYLARMLSVGGLRTGLYVSPHLDDWTERIRIDDRPCDPGELIEAVRTVHELAASRDARDALRFFDVLTLAAEQIVARAGASVAVFEAGIGGRLDAVRVLRPSLVLLTGVALDHADLLGPEPADVLREKLLLAPPGSSVLSARLEPDLEALAEDLAVRFGLRLAWMDPGEADRLDLDPELPRYLRSAFALAVAGRRLVATELLAPLAEEVGNGTVPAAIDVRIPGRLERGLRAGVPYVLDAGHNEAAWLNLAAELNRHPVAAAGGGPVTAVISISPGKQRRQLAAALRSLSGLDEVIVTRHASLPAADPATIAGELQRAGGLQASAVEDVASASQLAFERAGRSGGGVVVFGSTYLVGDVRRLLRQE